MEPTAHVFSQWAAKMTQFIKSRYQLVAITGTKKIFALMTPPL